MHTERRRPHEVDQIRNGLKQALRGGARPAWLASCPELIHLGDRRGQHDDEYVSALRVERIILRSLNAIGDGPYGRAASHLFGLSTDSRGRLLKDRRRLAAEALDVLPSTFRKNYEDRILEDLAIEFWRLTHQNDGVI